MLNILKDSVLQVLGMPLQLETSIRKFSTHTLVLINGTSANGRAYVLPGSRFMSSGNDAQLRFFGIEFDNQKILVVQDVTISDAIMEDDENYFQDLNDFTFICNMKHQNLSIEELFRPLGSLISDQPKSKHGNILEYKTAISSSPVFVREGSNRAKFISGKSDFFDDPKDFYCAKSAFMSPDKLAHSAGIRELGVEEYILELLTNDTIPAAISLLVDNDMRAFVSNVIRLRELVPSKITLDTYWEGCEDSDRGIATFSRLNWKDIQEQLTEARDTTDSYSDISQHIVVESSPSNWHLFTSAVFWNFYLLLDKSKVDFIRSTFNL
jgi:hypothetical protein